MNRLKHFTLFVLLLPLSTYFLFPGSVSAETDKPIKPVLQKKGKGVLPALTEAEQTNMQFMFEEERLLRDICTELSRSSTLPMIANMRKISARRMQVLKKQMKQRNKGLQWKDQEPGDFSEDPERKKKYRKALQLGKLSRLNALRIVCGMKEEQTQHYTRLAGQTDKPGLQKLYRQFSAGSEDHIRHLYKRIGKEGASYSPQHMPRNDFMRIIKTP